MLRRPTRISILILTLPLVAGASLAAPPPLPADAPPLDRLNAEMKKIRGQLRNASVKMKNGIKGLGGKTGEDTSVMKSCCGSNLGHIARAALAIDGLLPDLAGCYESENNDMASAAVEFYRNDLRAFARAMALLQDAQGPHDAKMFMDGTTRAFLQLRESGDELPACPRAGESPAE